MNIGLTEGASFDGLVDDGQAGMLVAPEAEHLIQALRPLAVADVASDRWLTQHGWLERLNMQAHVNVRAARVAARVRPSRSARACCTPARVERARAPVDLCWTSRQPPRRAAPRRAARLRSLSAIRRGWRCVASATEHLASPSSPRRAHRRAPRAVRASARRLRPRVRVRALAS